MPSLQLNVTTTILPRVASTLASYRPADPQLQLSPCRNTSTARPKHQTAVTARPIHQTTVTDRHKPQIAVTARPKHQTAFTARPKLQTAVTARPIHQTAVTDRPKHQTTVTAEVSVQKLEKLKKTTLVIDLVQYLVFNFVIQLYIPFQR